MRNDRRLLLLLTLLLTEMRVRLSRGSARLRRGCPLQWDLLFLLEGSERHRAE